MNRTKLAFSLAITLAAGFTSCSDNEDLNNEVLINGKHPIMLSSSLSESKAVTRAKGDGTGSEIKFTAATKIALSVNSDKKNVSTATSTGFRKTTATVTTEVATEPKTKVTFEDSERFYWDDFYGRDAQLTMYAVGVEGKKDGQYGTTNSLAFIENTNNIAWTLSTTQTTDTYAQEDLLVSNNIKKVGEDASSVDSRLSHNGSFPTGNLLFTHATSKIIVNINKGEGIVGEQFKNPTLSVNGFYTKGTMDASNGVFTIASGTSKTDITPIKLATTNTYKVTTTGSDGTSTETTKNYDFSYECLVLPNRSWDDDLQIFTFTADNNTYNITTKMFNAHSSKAEADRLTGNIEAGKQYIFNITFNKSQIELTAQVKDWDTQTPDGLTPVIPTGTGIGATGLGTVENMLATFDMYRSKTQNNGYDENSTTSGINYATTVTYKAAVGTTPAGFSCSPVIYWPNHTDAYFFRGIGELNEDGKSTTAHPTVVAADSKEYVAINTCETKDGKTVKAGSDICMGAPYEKTDGKIGALTGAKQAKDGDVNFTFKHGLAEIYIQLLTTTSAEGTGESYKDEINLTNATIEVENSITSGKYMLGTVAVEAGTTRTASYTMSTKMYGSTENPIKLPTKAGETQMTATGDVYRCYAIPQDLSYTSDDATKYITFKITCTESDGKTNTYYVDARNPQVQTGGSTVNAFTKWEAGNQYLYQVTLKRTKIGVTATLVPWAAPNVIDKDVQL